MKVTLIGAGPGDSELLTLKGLRLLQSADVVLYDRLIGEGFMELMPEAAEKINVGKDAGSHPVSQHEINQLILEKALEGKHVVRLKGGDPYVFGRGGEELMLLIEHGVPFEVVPGISSAIAAGTYAGIPVTHRDFVSSLHIITGHGREDSVPDIAYNELVGLKGTLVFLMSVSAIASICAGLLKAGMRNDMPAAIIENATTSTQRKFIGRVSDLPRLVAENNVVSPAVFIVGKVASLSDKLDWFSGKPLFGRSVVVTQTQQTASKLKEKLKEAGCGVYMMPCVKTVPEHTKALEESMLNIRNFNWLVFTSGPAVTLFMDYLRQNRIDIRTLHHLKIAAVGSETKRTIEGCGLLVDYMPAEYSGEELAKGLVKLVQKNECLLIPRAKQAARELDGILEKAGVSFSAVPIYDTVYASDSNEAVIGKLQSGKIDAVTFASSSGVEAFAQLTEGLDYSKVTAVCIGEKTAETARKYGMDIQVSAEATVDSMVEKVKEMFKT